MGVKNLWRLLLPIGKRISIETLSHQTLAIDASIWLTQISKACRDPETGRLLPNRPHVRIFLLRLMRLLFHRIKPVVVFDGIMPEVKRRELQRRRDRREKLWRGAGENGEDADLALKRTAKKILVKQLKEWREKKLEADAVADGGNVGKKRSPSKRSSSKNGSETGGAFAAGFTTGEEEADAKVPSTQSDNTGIDDNHAGSSEKQDKSNDADDIISIKSSSSDKEEQTKPGDVNNIDSAYESENDWEMSVAIQSSINDSIEQHRQQQIQYQDLSQQPVEAIASLPTEARSQWMESQYKAQRIQSRRECIDAAANPEDYSSTQLRNFLKGSKLNKKMGEIGKLAGQLEVQKDDDNGFVTVEENDDGGGASDRRRVLKRPQNKDDNDSDDDILNNELPTTKVLFGEDSDESEDDNGEEGGGFLLPGRDAETEQVKQVATLASDEIVIDDASDEDDGSIRETSAAAAAADAGSNTFNTSNEEKCDGMIAALPSEAARSQLMALTSADQEWANWGDNDMQHSASEGQVTKSITMKPSNADILSAESDSDDEPTFLPSQQHQKVQSSFIDTATKPDALSDKPVSPTQCAVEDEEDDDVDWEDGSDVDQGEGDGHEESNQSLDQSSSELSCQKDGNDNEDPDDEDIDWEDGGECNQVNDEEEDSMVKLKGNHILPSKQTNDNDDDEILSDKKQRKVPNLFEHDGDSFNNETIEIEELTDDAQYHFDNANEAKEIFDAEEAEPIKYEADPSNNTFDVEEFDSDDPTTAALRHAQETASRLTDWAGRAVQRAIAAHIEEKGGSSPSKIKTKDKSPMVGLTVGDDEEEFEDDHESDLEVIDVNNSTTVENKNTKDSTTKTADLFDTSLEGLNKVHHDIMEEEKLMERDMSTITDEMKMDILNLLQLCGIPWVESPSEAEAQCAELEKLGLVDGVVTEDSDVFVFGGRKVYKNFFNEQKYVEAYFAKDMLKDLGLGRSQLVALAMLLGGDYTDGVKGVGIVNGMEILQSFAVEDGKEGIRIGLQRFREWLDGLDDPVIDEEESSTFVSKVKLFHKKHQSARTRWIAPADFPSPAIIDGYMKPAVDSSETNFTWGKPDIDGLRQFCANSIGWNNDETDRVVKPVLNILESGSTQTRIESYFMKYEDNIKFAEVKSKRLKAVLDDIQTTGDDEEGSNKRRRTDATGELS